MIAAIQITEQATETGIALPLDLLASARNYAAAAKSERTRRTYRSLWQGFVGWCETNALAALPALPSTVALYLTARADSGRKVATLDLDLAAISQAHKMAGYETPRSSAEVKAVVQGIRRVKGVAQTKKAPVLVTDLRRMVARLPTGILGARDRALLLVGFAGAFRRSELAYLEVGDVTFGGNGLEVILRRSKTDQEGEGQRVGVPYGSDAATCPVRALRAWLDRGEISEGQIFRNITRHGKIGAALTPHSVARVVKRAAKASGLDPKNFAGHSLRSGLVTSAVRAGKNDRVIMKQTRHRSVAVMRGYVRDAESLFEENAASGIGL